ncbi:hypothetical protein QN360_02170 [Glaciimonas sp. CA11.2]|nr:MULTISPECIES: hypothetical protein [unclassified Glaciimonas]MDY7549154.1 hypothetical protein [Glaciimonas sp. CA11.2]MEB0014370.1 hypothetical protein [Glaciimonas sp. Cout2]MEB0084239.1 hypothetical protein [Glaciimonas sp. Gout2]MEB0161711.1 hypothetical protein [Glaciimonas sp. CA11.2]
MPNFEGMGIPLNVILLCICCYVVGPLSYKHLVDRAGLSRY